MLVRIFLDFYGQMPILQPKIFRLVTYCVGLLGFLDLNPHAYGGNFSLKNAKLCRGKPVTSLTATFTLSMSLQAIQTNPCPRLSDPQNFLPSGWSSK